MDNFDLNNYLYNNPLLSEIKVNQPGSFSQKDIEAIDTLTDTFGEGNSEIERDYPLKETYSLNDYSTEDPKYLVIQHLLKKSLLSYLTQDIFDFTSAPGAPENAFYTKVTINKEDQTISVEVPHLDEGGEYYMGWFGPDKKYYPDVDNFTEDGEYIGGAE